MTTYEPSTKNACGRCGGPAQGRRLCKSCARSRDHDGVVGGTSEPAATEQAYECCACGAQYTAHGAGAHCPECDSQRCRAAPEVAD